ncbi:FadR/GntR family transcriptional regulator [Novosphingobium sp. ST904]|uniref:FadR/GntR family transcriptional regulator n=1 Tax=Novosphingobium sp. ST904 TaxID=1684385 RepID=UPI000A89BA47|nr:FadR/GntR family transcriptional regulator [Novosphingobium sp. ST904]TCM41348.1 GntR family transcriptional regulator [Novosphingobium sp. ST904]
MNKMTFSLTPEPDALAAAGHGRLHHDVARRLALRIVSGEYPTGHLFTAEVEHADALGVSRSVLREAFRMLTAKGLVSSRPKAGTWVNERKRWNLIDPDVLAWQLQCGASDAFLRDLFELRRVVEPQAAEMAALRREESQLLDMANALDTMEHHTLQSEKGRAADLRFHALLMEATHNEMLLALSNSILTAIASTTAVKQHIHVHPRDPMPEHRELHRHIADRSPGRARRAMRKLIDLALGDMEMALKHF